jgi:hypothetical protein
VDLRLMKQQSWLVENVPVAFAIKTSAEPADAAAVARMVLSVTVP